MRPDDADASGGWNLRAPLDPAEIADVHGLLAAIGIAPRAPSKKNRDPADVALRQLAAALRWPTDGGKHAAIGWQREWYRSCVRSPGPLVATEPLGRTPPRWVKAPDRPLRPRLVTVLAPPSPPSSDRVRAATEARREIGRLLRGRARGVPVQTRSELERTAMAATRRAARAFDVELQLPEERRREIDRDLFARHRGEPASKWWQGAVAGDPRLLDQVRRRVDRSIVHERDAWLIYLRRACLPEQELVEARRVTLREAGERVLSTMLGVPVGTLFYRGR